MIPSPSHCYTLWEKYQLPEKKRVHSQIIADTASIIGKKLIKQGISLNLGLLIAACLLHDIDKAVPKKEGERHPESSVRILTSENLPEVAQVVRTHSLHCILNPQTKPTTWEQKVLYLVDKMVKYELIGVEERFKLWYAEDLPPQARAELDASLPLVKELEHEVFAAAGITDFPELQQLASTPSRP